MRTLLLMMGLAVGLGLTMNSALADEAPVGEAPAKMPRRRPCNESCQLDAFACVQRCNGAPETSFDACADSCQKRGVACRERCTQDNRY